MRLRRFLVAILLSLALAMPSLVAGQRHGGSHHSSSSSSHSATKSHRAGSNDGRYQGGSGSSHKGGKYKNSNTGDHYRDRKAGTPR